MDLAGARGFQLMEAPNRELLTLWARRRDDLIEFEIVRRDRRRLLVHGPLTLRIESLLETRDQKPDNYGI